MPSGRMTVAAALYGALALGCAAGHDVPQNGDVSGVVGGVPMTNDLQSVTQAALADAVRRAPPGAAAPAVVRADTVTWPDGSLGCPDPGRMYTMALVPGYRILIRSGGVELDYHASARGRPFLCPAGRATDPVAGSAGIY